MIENLDFVKQNGLIPAIIQDTNTDKVLMMGFMNREALEQTMNSGMVTFYSRTRRQLWTKGETSGNFLNVVKIIPDCDNDTLLIKASPKGPVCHTGADTCFNEENKIKFTLETLESVVMHRIDDPKEGSYTNQLINAGINKIAQKVGEEAVELIIEAKDGNDDHFLNEAADLLYHFLVLLRAKGMSLNDVEKTLEQRHK